RGTQLVRRSTDHSYVQTLVAQGQLSEEEANDHPQSNVLTSCLGTEPEPTFTAQFIPRLQIGDTLLACSDGVWHYFNIEELGSVLNTLNPREASEFLIEKARQRANGVGDNLSLVILKVEPPVETKPTRRSSLASLN
ncbi:MAG: serine/threonine-protein phosphatase, partial [Proteobacteria bacterium]|nr:serine/threonine-protein phosphatase [Pseudomonadota bacterium]